MKETNHSGTEDTEGRHTARKESEKTRLPLPVELKTARGGLLFSFLLGVSSLGVLDAAVVRLFCYASTPLSGPVLSAKRSTGEPKACSIDTYRLASGVSPA